jgi:hypothetical protein
LDVRVARVVPKWTLSRFDNRVHTDARVGRACTAKLMTLAVQLAVDVGRGGLVAEHDDRRRAGITVWTPCVETYRRSSTTISTMMSMRTIAPTPMYT